jgi:hypothetical protein
MGAVVGLDELADAGRFGCGYDGFDLGGGEGMVDGVDGAVGGDGVVDEVEGVVDVDVEVEGGDDVSGDLCGVGACVDVADGSVEVEEEAFGVGDQLCGAAMSSIGPRRSVVTRRRTGCRSGRVGRWRSGAVRCPCP